MASQIFAVHFKACYCLDFGRKELLYEGPPLAVVSEVQRASTVGELRLPSHNARVDPMEAIPLTNLDEFDGECPAVPHRG